MSTSNLSGKKNGNGTSTSIRKCNNEKLQNHYVYVSDEFNKDIETTDISEAFVTGFINELQKSEAPFLLGDCIKNSNLFKKTRDRTYRFLFQKESLIIEKEEITFVCLRRILRGRSKDEAEYKKIIHDPSEFIAGFKNEEAALKSSYHKWDKERRSLKEKEEREKVAEDEVKLAEISQWIDNFKINFHFDVYETYEWKQSIFEKLDTYGPDFLTLLERIIVKKESEGISFDTIPHPDRPYIFKASMGGICILYEKLSIQGETKYLLHNAFEKCGEQSDAIDRAIATIMDDPRFYFTVIDGNYDKKEVSRCAERAYPSMIIDVEDREIWFDIQKSIDDNANLSLLPDQVELLEQIRFPVFINGQAGSGKSTMLYYLFAQLCYKKIIEPDNDNTPRNEIVFITENQHLLKNSMKEIAMLLRKNPQYSLDINEMFGQSIDPETPESLKKEIIQDALEKRIANYFSSFIGFLRKALDLSEGEYHLNQYINFYRFREAYLYSRILDEHGKWTTIGIHHISDQMRKKYSPEVAWYIIRTFIKGYRLSTELMENDFHEIVRDDRGNLDEDTYRYVYKEIYEQFYKKLTDKGYWDNIDLINEIERQKKANEKDKDIDRQDRFQSNFSIILCDEAQDFTKVELQILTRFSEFSNFNDLSTRSSFPVIFAGDPFQTVNPTGFSWTRLRSMFTEDIVRKFKLPINIEERFIELKMNYRSTHTIVKLANMIQYFRRVFLFEKDIKFPQVARQYANDQVVKPALLEMKGSLTEYRNSKLGLSIFIAPCEPGGEDTFIAEDGLEPEDFIIKSAAFLKGLEHDTVVVYKYGEHFINEILDNIKVTQLLNRNNIAQKSILNGGAFEHFFDIFQNEDFNDDNITFKVAYFFNKLYVAVTRARQELIVMDTPKGINGFWKPFLTGIEAYLNGEPVLPETCQDDEKSRDWRYQILGKETVLDTFESNPDYKQNISKSQQARIALKEAEHYFRKATEEGAVGSAAIERLNIAIQYYKRSGLSQEHEEEHINLCKAHIARIDGRWADAGTYFEQAEDRTAAVQCYWNGGCWPELINASKDEHMLFVGEFMLRSRFDVKVLTEKSQQLADLFTENEIIWLHEFEEKLIGRISNLLKKKTLQVSTDSDQLEELADAMLRLKLPGYRCSKNIAEIYFSLKMFDKALALWDPEKEKQNIQFLYATAVESQEIEKKFAHYFTLYDLMKKNKPGEKPITIDHIQCEIAQLYERHPSIPFSPKHCAILSEILMQVPGKTTQSNRIETILTLLFRNFENTPAEYTDQVVRLIRAQKDAQFIVTLLKYLHDHAKLNPQFVQILEVEFYSAILYTKYVRKVLRKILKAIRKKPYQQYVINEIFSSDNAGIVRTILEILIKIMVHATDIKPERLKSKDSKSIPLDHLILSFAKYYVNNFKNPTGSGDIMLKYEELANAVERTNRQYSEIARFYDTDIDISDSNSHISEETRSFLRHRWLKIKQKQHQMDVSSSSGMADESKTLKTFSKAIADWEMGQVTMDIIEKDSKRFPEYPNLYGIALQDKFLIQTHDTVTANGTVDPLTASEPEPRAEDIDLAETTHEPEREDKQTPIVDDTKALETPEKLETTEALEAPEDAEAAISVSNTFDTPPSSDVKLSIKNENQEKDEENQTGPAVSTEIIQKKSHPNYEQLYIDEKQQNTHLLKKIETLESDMAQSRSIIRELEHKLEVVCGSKSNDMTKTGSLSPSGSGEVLLDTLNRARDIISEINKRVATLQQLHDLPEAKSAVGPVESAIDELVDKLISDSISPAIDKVLTSHLSGLNKALHLNIDWEKPFKSASIHIAK
ncbi:UvrD-helicase domain-containing protein [Desulfonema magnum]|uniref:DNA helicase N-terminal domain-containing protein, UvrD/REP-like n=1 Tax=Desulfonema magnum TaxID=45655 RepID=A0A975BX58_9BACT|nr:UvrD-helicase domain-containing protein [Desulfonema magnum]QTA93439.1 DNA helicase N-terminal domain-containing protein, UvrD/REP-like [Desulfonema magnum]